MKVKLDISERFALLSLMPEKGNFATQKVVMDLVRELGFDEKELERIEYKQVGDRANWNPEKDPNKEFDCGKYQTDVISDSLKELDEKDELEQRHITLYEKFVSEK